MSAELTTEMRLKQIQERIREIEERTVLRANHQWSETHNLLMGTTGDLLSESVAIAQADAGFAQADAAMLTTLLALAAELRAETGPALAEKWAES